MNISLGGAGLLAGKDAESALSEIASSLRAGGIVPYLGPGIFDAAPFPATLEALADFFATKVALPKRARGNAWAAAQHIESFKHRSTVAALMEEAFAGAAAPTPLHDLLARLRPPMIVDSWYDGTMRAALGQSGGWGEVQGISRAGIGEDRWYRFYDSAGAESSREAAERWGTLLYKPHGAVAPARNFLISDADYVEVLTEIDIQTPIPDAVKDRRAGRAFLYLGCRFHDQTLRSYAKQISKRSQERHWAVVDPASFTRNEARFLLVQGIVPLALPLARVVDMLAAA